MPSQWNETSKGVFRKPCSHWQNVFREFGNPEVFGGRENLLQSLTARLELQGGLASDDLIAQLKQTWKALRFEDPCITVEIDGTDVVYRQCDAEQLEEWVSSTFGVHDGEEPESWFPRKHTSRGTELHYFPDTKSVLLITPHWLHDYDGLLMTMQKFFRLLVQPPQTPLPWGREVVRLRPPFEELLDIHDPPESAAKSFVDEMFKAGYAAGPLCGLPVGLDSPPGNSTFFRAVFSPSTTSHVVMACKAKGYTVTAAVHAALALAVWELGPPSCQHLPQSLAIVRDMRRLVGPPLNGPNYAADCCLAFQLATVRKTESFADVVSFLKPVYRLGNDDEHKILAGAKESLDQVITWVTRPMDPTVPTNSPLLSSLGVIEPWLARSYSGSNGSVQVTDVAVLVNVHVPIPALWLYTFADRLRMTLSWNPRFFEHSLMDQVLLRLVDILKDGLDVPIVLEEPGA